MNTNRSKIDSRCLQRAGMSLFQDGAVVIEVTVNADGGVSNVKALSGNRMLSSAAEDAVRKWKFEPGDGQATIQVAINFSLSQ